MTRHERIESLLREHFPKANFTLFNDSVHHADHSEIITAELLENQKDDDVFSGAREHAKKYGASRKGQTHFRLHITDESFKGKTPVAIHREIFAAIKPVTDDGLHSIVIERASAP